MYKNKLILRNVVAIAICLAGSATLFAQETGVEINGVTWATRNVGAPNTFVINPEDAGMFYQWNSKIGWNYTDTPVPSDDTSVWDSSWNGGSAETWETANDPCPEGWKVPSFDDFGNLIASGGEWVTTPVQGVRYGSGENTVFIPAIAGFIYTNGSIGTVTLQAIYWSSTAYSSNEAYDFYFYKYEEDEEIDYEHANHAFGFNVRCVKSSNSGVDDVLTDTENAAVTGYVDMVGRKLLEEPQHGIYFILYDNGKTKKVIKP